MSTDPTYTPPEIASLMGLIDTHLRWKDAAQEGDRKYYRYHPSEWGDCLRRQQYKHFVQLGYVPPHPEKKGSQKIRLFDKGHNMHSRWQNWYFAEMGILRGNWKCKNQMCFSVDKEGKSIYNEFTAEQREKMWKVGGRVHGKGETLGCFRPEQCVCGCRRFDYQELIVSSEEMNFEGHCDIVLDFSNFDFDRYKGVRKSYNEKVFPTKPIVIDMKTINDWGWKSKLMKTGPSEKYIIQVTSYVHLLDCEWGVILYENKNDSDAAAYKVERNDRIFDEIKKQSTMMVALSKKKLLPPPRPREKDDGECKYCEFSSTCHESPIWDDKDLEDKRKRFYGKLL